MSFVTANFDLLELDKLENEVWEVVKKHRKDGVWIGLPYLTPLPIYIIDIQFYGDISKDSCKSIWLRFSIDTKNIDFVESVENSDFLKDLEEVVKQYFESYCGIWEINKYFVQPL